MLKEIDQGIEIHRVWWNILKNLGLKGQYARYLSDISLGIILLIFTYSIYHLLYNALQSDSVKNALGNYIKESKVGLVKNEILVYLLRLFICFFFIGISHDVLDSTTSKEYTLPLINLCCKIYSLYITWYIVHHSLYVADDIYRSYKVGRRLPITSYIQTLQIIIFIVFVIITFFTFINIFCIIKY